MYIHYMTGAKFEDKKELLENIDSEELAFSGFHTKEELIEDYIREGIFISTQNEATLASELGKVIREAVSRINPCDETTTSPQGAI